MAPGLLSGDAAGGLVVGHVIDPAEVGALGRQLEPHEHGGRGRLFDGAELRRDQYLLGDDDALAEREVPGGLGALERVAVLLHLEGGSGDADVELTELRHDLGLAQAGRAEHDVGDVAATAGLAQVDVDELLGETAGLGDDVTAVLHDAVGADREAGVGRSDELVRDVGGRGEGVEVDLLADDATPLDCPADVAADDAGEARVVGAVDVVEVLLEDVDLAVVGATERVVHDVVPFVSHVCEGRLW